MFLGFFSTTRSGYALANGLFYGGGLKQLWIQAVSAGSVLAYSFVIALILGLIIEKTIGFRVSEEAEAGGIDLAEHAETAYEFSGFATPGSGMGTISSGVHLPGEKVDA